MTDRGKRKIAWALVLLPVLYLSGVVAYQRSSAEEGGWAQRAKIAVERDELARKVPHEEAVPLPRERPKKKIQKS